MSRQSLLALAAVAGALSGCEYTKPLPAQLAVPLTLTAQAGTPTEKEHLRALADGIMRYLSIDGLTAQNTRVRFDETNKSYAFELYGRQAVAPALLDQVAKRFLTLERDRVWTAKVAVAPLEHLDTLLGGKERNFPVSTSWKHAAVDAYVIQSPNLGFAIPTLDANGERRHAPKTGVCMLSFKPEPALPKLEGTFEQVYGNLEGSSSSALRRRVMGDQLFSAPYEVTFDEPALAQAFKEAPMAKDGKLMFKFAVLEDVNVIEFVGGDTAPMDMGGATQQKCERALTEKFPALALMIERVKMLEQVQAFGQARVVPAPAKP